MLWFVFSLPLLSRTAAHLLRGRIQKHIFGRLCNRESALQNVHPGTQTFKSIQMSHILITILLRQESLHRTMEQPRSVSSEHGCAADAKISSQGFHTVPIGRNVMPAYRNRFKKYRKLLSFGITAQLKISWMLNEWSIKESSWTMELQSRAVEWWWCLISQQKDSLNLFVHNFHHQPAYFLQQHGVAEQDYSNGHQLKYTSLYDITLPSVKLISQNTSILF